MEWARYAAARDKLRAIYDLFSAIEEDEIIFKLVGLNIGYCQIEIKKMLIDLQEEIDNDPAVGAI